MSQPENDLIKASENKSQNEFNTPQFQIARVLSITFNVILILAQIKLLKDHNIDIKTYAVFIFCNISILVNLLAPRLTKLTLKQVGKYTAIPTIISVFLFLSQTFS
ncbi:fumarate hydratase [Photobacterium toruni]|uniref:fumarate hydratase n=1 Tax=Photobacterium toruni TaxID=1935446 RepID=UPI00210FC1FD|nr:fumarate hydratase [Photobacterium toruni]